MNEPMVDADRLLAWANESPRRPASIAFTAGAERQAAYWIEWGMEWGEKQQAAELDRLRAENEALREALRKTVGRIKRSATALDWESIDQIEALLTPNAK